jgi:flagellar basal-body rod protein FlgC
MGLTSAIRTTASGLTAQRLRMDIISNNLANANSTRTNEGGAYKRQTPVFEPILKSKTMFSLAGFGAPPTTAEDLAGGVRVTAVTQDMRQGKLSYEPGHPDANADGYVEYPNVNVVSEMTDMISATRSYEANVTAMQSLKNMAMKALELGRA